MELRQILKNSKAICNKIKSQMRADWEKTLFIYVNIHYVHLIKLITNHNLIFSIFFLFIKVTISPIRLIKPNKLKGATLLI